MSLPEDGKIQRATVSVGSRAQISQAALRERELHGCLEAGNSADFSVTSAAKRQKRQ